MDASSISYSRLQEIISDTLSQHFGRPTVVAYPANTCKVASLLESQSSSALEILREDLELLHGPTEINCCKTGTRDSQPAEKTQRLEPSETDVVKLTQNGSGKQRR